MAWNLAQPSVLLSGGFDHRACLVRAPHTIAPHGLGCRVPGSGLQGVDVS